jgi:hypothetical protein
MSEPTMSLAEFIEGEKADPNLWWRLSSGDHQNLLDEAIDRSAELVAANERLRVGLQAIVDHATGANPRKLTTMSSAKAIAEFVLSEEDTP